MLLSACVFVLHLWCRTSLSSCMRNGVQCAFYYPDVVHQCCELRSFMWTVAICLASCANHMPIARLLAGAQKPAAATASCCSSADTAARLAQPAGGFNIGKHSSRTAAARQCRGRGGCRGRQSSCSSSSSCRCSSLQCARPDHHLVPFAAATGIQAGGVCSALHYYCLNVDDSAGQQLAVHPALLLYSNTLYNNDVLLVTALLAVLSPKH
jgi:hypothetical protein